MGASVETLLGIAENMQPGKYWLWSSEVDKDGNLEGKNELYLKGLDYKPIARWEQEEFKKTVVRDVILIFNPRVTEVKVEDISGDGLAESRALKKAGYTIVGFFASSDKKNAPERIAAVRGVK